MEIKVNVTLDLSERLQAFLSALPLCRFSDKPEAPEALTRCRFSDKPEAPKEAPKEEKKEEKKPGEPCPDEVLKDYMDLVFKQAIGDDWREISATDPEMKLRRAEITRCFKSIAAELGAAKPTLLPQAKRPEFIEKLNNITIGDDGRVQMLPF